MVRLIISSILISSTSKGNGFNFKKIIIRHTIKSVAKLVNELHTVPIQNDFLPNKPESFGRVSNREPSRSM